MRMTVKIEASPLHPCDDQDALDETIAFQENRLVWNRAGPSGKGKSTSEYTEISLLSQGFSTGLCAQNIKLG